jgi:hypothetical protein
MRGQARERLSKKERGRENELENEREIESWIEREFERECVGLRENENERKKEFNRV